MSQAVESQQGDRVIEYLERGQHWVSENYKIIIAIIVASFGVAFFLQHRISAAKAEQMGYWEDVSKLSTLEKKHAFLKAQPKADASALLSLTLAREELDEGNFQGALLSVNSFIQNNKEHALIGTAYILRGYANEELGNEDRAVEDYTRASKEARAVAVVADDALKRLGKNITE